MPVRLVTLFFALTMASANAIEVEPEVLPLQLVDQGHLDRYRTTIEDITRTEFGARLHRDSSDLRLLNRLIKNDFIAPADTTKQLAMGVVLGDVFVSQLGLEWKIYKDAAGESHATCIPRSTTCLFPVTMLSKRMKLGVKPDTYEMFEHGKSLLQDHLPKLPYAVKKQ